MIKKFNEHNESISFPKTEEEIRLLCEEYNISKYTINLDFSIDVHNQYVNFSHKKLTALPLKFNMVESHFGCSGNRLKSLEGCPNYVGGNFYCYQNPLYTFDGCPEFIDEDCYVHNNNPIDEIISEFYGTCDYKRKLLESWKTFSPIYKNKSGEKWYVNEYKFCKLFREVTGKYYEGKLKPNSYIVDYEIDLADIPI